MVIQDEVTAANDRLNKASNDYAALQDMIDRYNRVFETYANASIETQRRAASVMRQALDEYSNLKRQQQQNALRIYQVQNDVDRYRQIISETQSATQTPNQGNVIPQGNEIIISDATTQTSVTPDVKTTEIVDTPSVKPVINSVANVTANTNTQPTINTPVTQSLNKVATQNKVQTPVPSSVQNYVNATTPQFSNTTIWPVNRNLWWQRYWSRWTPSARVWAGSVAGL